MQSFNVLLVLGILAEWSCSAIFLNNQPFPTYSLEDMPATLFTCRDKILGGYYADPDAQCQMFHVCVKVAGVGIQDFRFLCPNGTAFDQDHQICADWEDVDCDATTLYYSSDNFDLYRIGSGYESKAHKYGEDEEPFALQRAETGDARLNREPQTQVVNQRKEYLKPQVRKNVYTNNNQDRDIFKTSSSSNFFNNRNNGKENDEDYDDNVNVNQDRDYEQKRKVIRKQQRRPAAQNIGQVSEQPPQQKPEIQTRKPQRPTGFSNNFAGSSYNPTSPRPSSTAINDDQYTTASNTNNNFRRGQRQRINNGASIASSSQSSNPPTPTYTISTPAPFRQSSSAVRTTNQNGNNQYYTSSTENYPQNFDVTKIAKNTENYPSNNPQYSKQTTPFQYNTGFDKKSTSLKKVDTKTTTFSPNAKPFSVPNNSNTQQTNQILSSFPTTFAPKTQQAYTQIAQQTNSYNQQTNSYSSQRAQNTGSFSQQKPTTFAQPFSSLGTTQRSTVFTQYTPTVPKISSTTPVTRSNRFDETQYDDGSYDSKYDNNGSEDEFLNTAHSQNIASNRNEFAKIQKQQQPISTTQKPYEVPKTYKTTTYAPRQTENSPRSTQYSAKSTQYSAKSTQFSTKSSQYTTTSNTQVTQKPLEKKSESAPKTGSKAKSVSYDYAYYDSFGPEPDYHLDSEIQKSTVKN